MLNIIARYLYKFNEYFQKVLKIKYLVIIINYSYSD